ncbi:MAG: serine hydrolase, partial [Dehalococcoidia bacterium]|nr:serine hydrolase [Dehalococcoidia bacterium]
NKEKNPTEGRHHSFLIIAIAILILSMLVGCGPSTEDLEAVDYTPLPGDDWNVSTPVEQGLDPMLVAELYFNAAELETLYGLLVIKNSHLIAEVYFNEGAVDRKNQLQSATKSYTSALVGIALDQGCLSSVDQKMIDFFPEFADKIDDPRKEQITIRDMLQMRSGYPFEETDPALFEALLWGDYLPLIVHFPLTRDPGTEFQYSNLTSHWLGVIVARACDTDLKSFAQEYLFSPLDSELGDDWIPDRDGYYIGLAGMHVTARDMAKFGLLYLNDGEYEGKQVLSADWVRDSLQRYSEVCWGGWMSCGYGYFRDLGYGYQWWSSRAGDRYFNYASGHGGQYIVVLDELDMVIVTAADPFWQQHDDESWKHESAVIELVGKFINALPSE